MHTCQDCGMHFQQEELLPYKRPVDPGDVMPSGECPCCGAACLPEKELTKEWLMRLTELTCRLADTHNKLRRLMIEIKAPHAVYVAGRNMTDAHRLFREVVNEELDVEFVVIPDPDEGDDEPLTDLDMQIHNHEAQLALKH